ncbi:hypothetical protein V6251_05740 [Olleya sp. Ti.3.14]|uniref:hypothetical protein n=1 Tax=Olleya sp. Ti.3.14 TaxID=3121297 RepID=UPI00311EC6A0
MGGEGSMMAANQSLKSNRNMLAKRKEKSFSFVSNSKEKTKYNLPKASDKDIALLRNKLKKEHKVRRVKQIVLLIITLAVMLSIFTYLV